MENTKYNRKMHHLGKKVTRKGRRKTKRSVISNVSELDLTESLSTVGNEKQKNDSSKVNTVEYETIKEKILHLVDISADELETLQGERIFIQELSNKLNELQDTYTQNRDSASLAGREKSILIKGVRISPGTMIFKDAYDGKSYNQTLTITNCGKHPVTIRIFPPTSKAFKMKPDKTGRILSSGISLVRTIKFLYTKPTAIPQALMDIYINNTCYRYELVVITCFTKISVSPKIIDFGEIDVGMVSSVKYLTITNSGTKQAQYSIDLGGTSLEAIINPLKGTVQPKESKKISIEIFGTTEGEFQQEFWIKTDPLQRVFIQGNFIEPSLKVDYPPCDKNFVVLYFPKTFVGVKRQKNVVIKNHSSTHAVFCVMGRTKDEKIPIKDAAEKDINYRQFYINPTEGRLHSDQQYIMGLTFIPQKPKNHPPYYLCSVIVDVKRCRVGNASTPKDRCPDTQNVINSPLLDSVSILTLDEQNEPEQDIMSLNDMITILLYGEVEIPHIIMEPRKVCVNNLKMNEIHIEPLKILNTSKTLPILIKYNKVAFIEVEPKTIFLPPNQEVEATIRLRPSKMGDTDINVVFDMFYREHQESYNIGTVTLNVFCASTLYTESRKLLKKRKPYFVPGITPLVTNEVGYQVDDVRFNSNIEKPRQAIVDQKFLAMDKNNDALIAFPNDQPKSLRPWRNPVPCNTIFAKLPRIVTEYDQDYDLNSQEKYLQETTQSYYKNYIKSLSSKQQSKEFDESIGDYVTTNEKLILMQHLKMGGECPPIVENLNKLSLFVPLAPYELHNIIVTPKFIQLGRLAAHTECSNHFNVENKNGFPVHISIKAFYPSITIHHEQFILAKNARKNINFTYHSDYSGTHHIPVFVIINFFFVFDLTVLAKIVSNTVKCITKDILIVPTERTAFLELRNPINSELKFMIDTTFFHLESFPSSGVIPAKRNMICTITFNPEVGYMPVKEIAVVSESGAKEIVEVHFDRKKAAVALSTDTLNFGDIPLNTTVSKELSVKNNSDQLVPVNIEIENSDLFPEVTINPMRAFLWQKGDMVITFTVKLKEVVQFSLPVKIIFQYEFPQIVTVTGNVIFPEISLSPPLLKIQKIPSGAVVKTPFRVINASTVANFLSFPLKDFPEFRITTKTGENVTKGLTLGPKEKKEINLEFHPQEPVAYCIYLPYILNGTLGPPELNRPDSLRCSEYLLSVINDYKKNAEGVFPKLTAIKILCAAGKKWLHFSSTSLTFSSLTQPSNEFVVTNVSNTIHQITFKVTNNEAFRFMTSESDMALVESNIEISIPPEDSFKIAIEFDPTSYGTFTAEVPIYVKDYSETVTFNILKLSGSNPLPQIKTSKTACYFLPATIGSRLNDTLTIELEAHKCDGSVEVECENSIIEVWWSRQENISDLKIVLYYTIMFAPVSDCIIETKVKFSCACSASTEVEVYACGDSSIVSNFMADPDVVDQSTYPYYPAIDDKSDYAKLMHSMVPIIEGWLYTQGYMYQNYYKIPEDIARYPVNTEKNKKGAPTVKKKTIPQLPLVQLLINLMDQSILKYIDNGLQPSEELKGRTLYNYVTYRNTVSFLKSQGIFVPGLKPEHLLCYIEYLEYKNNLVDKQTPPIDEDFTEDLFYRFSKQKWLDLFFQIYKVLVFQRIVDPQPIECENKQGEALEEDFITKDRAAFEKYFKKRLKRFPNWFRCDAKLLLWLEYHYNRQRSVLWPNENFGKKQRFDNFSIIDDSVALATVTAAYCPYLSEQLRDVYACPKKLEHKVHNACKVVQVWKSLKLSFEILPQTIVTGNKINIFFIVTYLYEVLPHFYPTNDVRIEAPLSESASYELTVSNCEDALIQYIAIFFGEGSESFILDNQQIMIPGKQSKKIRLTYLAKKVLEANCILVLSGEASGQKYAKTMAISITGIPNISQCETIDIQVPTYEEVKKKISLQSPYGKSYNAKICMCFQTPKSYKDFLEISVIKEQRIPREINVIQNECHFVGKGEATITLDMCLLSQGPKSFHLYFFNNTIGDFCILMNISPLMTIRKAEELLVTLPNTYNAICSCKRGFNKHCPKAFRVSIPCRNPLLWKSMGVVVERCFFHSVALQWIKKYSGTPLVFRTFKFYLERFPQGFMLPSSIFEDHAEFEITPNKKYSTESSTFKIPDVTGEDSIPLIIHWNDRDIPKEEVIELRNTNKKEIRYFKLVFLKPFSSSTLVSESTDREINSVGSKKVSSNTIESIKESKESIISSRSK